MTSIKYLQPGQDTDSAIGRNVGSNLLDCILMAKAKNTNIIPSWNKMSFFNSSEFDIAPFLFDLSNVSNVSIIEQSESVFKKESPIFKNTEFVKWLKNCSQSDFNNEKLSRLCLFGFPGYENNTLLNEFRNILNNNICKIKKEIIDEADEYIQTNLQKKYISIHFRSTGALNVLKMFDNDIYNKLIRELINVLKKITTKDIDSFYLASCSWEAVNNIRNIIKEEFNLPVYSLSIDRTSNIKGDNIIDNIYLKEQTISYYLNTMKELIILSKGSYFIRTFGKYSLTAAIMSNLYCDKIYTLTDNIIENLFSKMYENVDDIKVHINKSILSQHPY